jgi:hypothetical protein
VVIENSGETVCYKTRYVFSHTKKRVVFNWLKYSSHRPPPPHTHTQNPYFLVKMIVEEYQNKTHKYSTVRKSRNENFMTLS